MVTNSFPPQEMYALTSQMRRSASSIPTNIAEGCGKGSNAEMRRYLFIAAGSCSELEYQFILSKDLKYIPEKLFKELQQEIVTIRKMIFFFH